MAITDVQLNTLDGSPDVLAAARDKVSLVVNVASKCGLTPQYTQLEEIQERYADRGFTVVGVPCNQFGEQEPGSPEEIQTFCSTTYGVTFPMSEKVDVNGENRHELYRKLVTTEDSEGHSSDIRWNFEKFLLANDGSIVARFAPTTTPDDPTIIDAIESALG